ncbi:MAG: hypothetical protein J0H23_02140 [Micrococcales bacterium]|nr:hypothetical protein [Micrococcales bacterium]OJX66521.1 MAG: hypothetical protein BGO94_06545 [Micrococcales bacterium 72-143]
MSALRRAILYLIYDERGSIDDYIPYKLERLRPFAERIIIIVNGKLDDAGRMRLTKVSDEIWQRENVGFDVGGFREGLSRLGSEIADYDEIILMNYTWFGPVRPFEPLFERMDAADLDFWGLTDHGAVTPDPLTGTGTMPDHLQSHWIAVRRSMFLSDAWRRYWDEMPDITSYHDSIQFHEARFTSHFRAAGFRGEAAFPHQDYAPLLHPAFEAASQLIDDGCPALKRRPLFHDPLYLDREGLIGRWLVEAACAEGYPMPFIWQSMAQSAAPRVLYTNAAMMEILSEQVSDWDEERPPRIAAITHIYYPEMADELLDRLALVSPGVDLVVTTSDDEKAGIIRALIAERADPGILSSEVRITAANRGRDQSAFYITCRDIILDDRYDLVIKLHSKLSPQDGPNRGEFFRRQQWDNLLPTRAYAENVIGMFQREPGLGVVFPPMIHIGFPTMGNAWFTNRKPAEALCERLGIHTPLEEGSPLAPFGGMFVARPEALRLLAAEEWRFDEYPAEGEYGDGTLSHVQERIVAHAAAELGYHSRTIANREYAAISHTMLEYKLDQTVRDVPGYGYDQVHALRPFARLTHPSKRAVISYYLHRFHPRLVAAAAKFLRRRT